MIRASSDYSITNVYIFVAFSKSSLCHCSTIMPVPQDSRFSEANLKRIQKLPHEECNAKLKALSDELIEQLAKFKETAAPPLSVEEYLRSLASLDLTSDAAISSFKYHGPAAGVKPLPLGSHIDIHYFLLPCRETVPPAPKPSKLKRFRRDTSDFIDAYQHVPILSSCEAPDIKFGFGLGKLMYTASTSTAPEPADLTYSGFYVLLNVVDRSVWITIDWFPSTETGDRVPINVKVNKDWGRLPSDNQLQTGTMMISQNHWETSEPLAIAKGDPFAESRASTYRLLAERAVLKDMKKAREAATTSTRASTPRNYRRNSSRNSGSMIP